MSANRGNIATEAAPPSTLTEFERQCADLDAKDWNPRQIACVLERGEGAVLQALKSARLKMEAGRCEEAAEFQQEVRRQAQESRDLAAAAMNWRTDELTVAEKPEKGKEPLRWAPWPFRDHAAQSG